MLGLGFFRNNLTKKVNCFTFISQKSTYAGAESNVVEKIIECKFWCNFCNGKLRGT